ncbi:hypothetical protein [Halospeciosus flavus]|uniref:Uncharacterized protein n=1 Tax=Halospeciosus flavus TaxID=3032283 RepID=A0ABD5Z8L0_9EURY|nr:hypothetical protein [Halospeciosus flavus]
MSLAARFDEDPRRRIALCFAAVLLVLAGWLTGLLAGVGST